MDPRCSRETALLGKLAPPDESLVISSPFTDMITDGIIPGTWDDPCPVTSMDAFNSFGLERVLPQNETKHKVRSCCHQAAAAHCHDHLRPLLLPQKRVPAWMVPYHRLARQIMKAYDAGGSGNSNGHVSEGELKRSLGASEFKPFMHWMTDKVAGKVRFRLYDTTKRSSPLLHSLSPNLSDPQGAPRPQP